MSGEAKRRLLRLGRRLCVGMGCDLSVVSPARATSRIEVDSSPPSNRVERCYAGPIPLRYPSTSDFSCTVSLARWLGSMTVDPPLVLK